MQVPLPLPMSNAAGAYSGPMPANAPPNKLMQQISSPGDFSSPQYLTQASDTQLQRKQQKSKKKIGKNKKAESPTHGINPMSPTVGSMQKSFERQGHYGHDRSEEDQHSDTLEAGANTEYSFISKQLDAEMRQLVQDYEGLKA